MPAKFRCYSPEKCQSERRALGMSQTDIVLAVRSQSSGPEDSAHNLCQANVSEILSGLHRRRRAAMTEMFIKERRERKKGKTLVRR